MRITTSMMSSKYLRNLNKSAYEMNQLSQKVDTGRKFFKGSEDPVSAIKAYKLRREYRTTEIYETNIKDVESFLTSAETNLTEISSNLEFVYTSYLKGINGTMNAETRDVIAKELENLQQSILTSLNANFEDRYVFGGTSKEEIPFTLDKDGNLLFKGLNVNDSANKDALDKIADETIYIDLGLGMTFDSTGLNTDTVFNMSMSGIKFMGYGTSDGTSDGIPKNLYTLIGEIKNKLRDPNFSLDEITPYIDKFEEQKSQVLVNITDIGAKTNYLDFLKTRNEDNQFNLNKKILEVEFEDPKEAIVNFKMQEYSYNAALSMGNKILQNSFIDFMR